MYMYMYQYYPTWSHHMRMYLAICAPLIIAAASRTQLTARERESVVTSYISSYIIHTENIEFGLLVWDCHNIMHEEEILVDFGYHDTNFPA